MKEEPKSSLARLRWAGLAAVAIGAIGSVTLLRRAQEHPPPLLVALFLVWILTPFVLLGVGNVVSTRWPVSVRKTLYLVTLIMAAVSLAIYLDDNINHRAAKRAFVYVMVPPASVLASAIAVGMAARTAKKANE